ncbi:HD domain-containing protein [Desulfovibrio sp. OttesenSCG-928-G15]|nr:HD domain-containing protein [Desulfovibrio sp. OttesenSCG-928-G15]
MSMVIKTTEAMIAFFAGDIRRINHFLCVHGLAKTIGEMEQLSSEMLEILEIAALTHDIGIKVVEDREGSCTPAQQEKEGPPAAEKLLRDIACPENIIERVSTLIGRHHTYTNVDGLDCQVLLEADFLVNIHGMGIKENAVQSFKRKVFTTRSGLHLLKLMYGA